MCWECLRIALSNICCQCTPLYYYCSHHVVCCSSELIRLRTEGFYPLTFISPFPFPQPMATTILLFLWNWLFSFFLYDFTWDTIQHLSFSVWLICFWILNLFRVLCYHFGINKSLCPNDDNVYQLEIAHLLVILHNFINREAGVQGG